jgi:hypothetical protein
MFLSHPQAETIAMKSALDKSVLDASDAQASHDRAMAASQVLGGKV